MEIINWNMPTMNMHHLKSERHNISTKTGFFRPWETPCLNETSADNFENLEPAFVLFLEKWFSQHHHCSGGALQYFAQIGGISCEKVESWFAWKRHQQQTTTKRNDRSVRPKLVCRSRYHPYKTKSTAGTRDAMQRNMPNIELIIASHNHAYQNTISQYKVIMPIRS